MAPVSLAPQQIDLRSDFVAASTMIRFLAQAAEEAREDAGRKRYHVAAEISVDPSTVYRFEKGQWPQQPDLMVSAYASDLQIEPIELWERALRLWREDLASSADVDEALRDLEDSDESDEQKPGTGG